ncbi:replication initiation protein [Neoroseomonas alba]|uniref:replication initiation protein n=1 Tax=Roseomonas alba TaxID=2846776 RepID=UPI001CA52579|nr:replication initiation protein [Neoroseomonas alba]
MSALPSSFEPAAACASFPAKCSVGRWHRRRPDLLAAALDQVRRTTPVASDIAEAILPRVPRRVLASQNLRTATTAPFSSVLPLDEAAICPWVSLDSETHRNVLAFDIDHTEALELVEELPAHVRPWLAIDPYSGRAHAFIFLATPVLVSRKGSDEPRISFKACRLAEVAQAIMTAALRATPLRHRALLKNPLGKVDALLGQQLRRAPQPTMPAMWDAWRAAGTGLVWHTVPGASPVELGAIIAALADDYGEAVAEAPMRNRVRRRRGEPSATGRNCSLFDQVRWFAYDHQERDGGAILAEAMRVNSTFAEPLPASEVAATARSIAKFMHSRYRPRSGISSPRGRDRAACAGLALEEERQAVAGRTTAAARAAETNTKIAAAVEGIRLAGERVTQAAVAAAACVSLRTVKRRWAAISTPSGKVPNAVVSDSGTASAAHLIGKEVPAALDGIETARTLKDGGLTQKAPPPKSTRHRKADDGRQRTLLLPLPGKDSTSGLPAGIGRQAQGPPVQQPRREGSLFRPRRAA